jgi:hypothetical protein
MSVHWHDDEHGFCPCDEPGGVVIIPPGVPVLATPVADDGPTFEVDYDERTDAWIGRCSEHGAIFQRAGDHDDHNAVVIALARHDEYEHDGDGMVHWQMWSI